LISYVANFGALKAQRVRRNGKDWLVAPIVSIVPGILPGSQGRLLYPESEVKDSTPEWDGIPITQYHPTTENGDPASAQDPGVLQRQGIGYLAKSQYNGKLTHQAWFDVERTKRIDSRIYQALIKGHPMEVSTGLFTDNYDPQPNETWKGQSFDYVARNYKPDHLAILPDQVGACSRNDGCGLLVNKSKQSDSMSLQKYHLLRNFMALIDNAGANQVRRGNGQFGAYGEGTGKGPVHEAAKAGARHHVDDGSDDSDDEDNEEEDDEDSGLDDPNEKDSDNYDPMTGDELTSTKGGKKAARNFFKAFQAILNADALEEDEEETGNDVDGDGEDGESEEHKTKIKAARMKSRMKSNRTRNANGMICDNCGVTANSKGMCVNCGKRVTANAGGFSKEDRANDATKTAAAASLQTDSDKSMGHAIKTIEAAKDGDSASAAKVHLQAAKQHESEALESRKNGDDMGAQQHDSAAAAHRKAASCHFANADTQGVANMFALNDLLTDDQRKAYFAKMADGGGDETRSAMKASESAQKNGTKAAHQKAAAAHKEAKEHHESEGNTELAEAHGKAATYHSRKAKGVKNMAINKLRLVQRLINNGCACNSDRKTLLSLSTKTLNAMAKKGVMADNDEDDDDEDYEDHRLDDDEDDVDEDEDKDDMKNNDGELMHSFDQATGKGSLSEGQQSGGKGTRDEYKSPKRDNKGDGKNYASTDNRLTSQERAILNRFLEQEKREKLQIVNKLISGLRDNTQRNLVGNQYMKMDKDVLRSLLESQFPHEPTPIYQGAAVPAFNAAPSEEFKKDILDIPVINYADLAAENKKRR